MGLQFKNIFQKIVNSLIGSSCNLCDNLSENIICNKCSDSFVFLNKTGKKFCTKCYDVVLNQTNDLCNRCYVGGNDLFLNIEKTKSILLYNNSISQLIYNYKYKDQTHIAALFFTLIENEIKQFIAENKIDYIVIIGLSQEKLLSRMFNQNALILRFLEKDVLFGSKIIYNCILKNKNTKNQIDLNYEARVAKKHYLSINQKYSNMLHKKNILIFDDVITTGSTISEAANLFKKYETNIFAFSIARTLL